MIVGGVVVETGLEKIVAGVRAQGTVPKRPTGRDVDAGVSGRGGAAGALGALGGLGGVGGLGRGIWAGR